MSSNGASGDRLTRPRIGLALSGGGFRASIFHLGVIRRLEELGIMQDVNVISTVSGGSIIGAYYVVEMERRFRERRPELKGIEKDAGTAPGAPVPLHAAVARMRVQIFHEIAGEFFKALDQNLRSRALPFSPFYHPILFFRSLWPTFSRSDIIQAEYDRVFFDKHPVDQLPNVTDGEGSRDFLDGPRLVINVTSLLTGERKGFSRVPVSGVREMNKPNTNVLPLSRVVGASSCVPGMFPPTPIFGDIFVDGGVSDNQGLDGLLDDGRLPPGAAISDDDADKVLRAARDYDAIIVSDACGQMEPVHNIKGRAAAVLPRTFSIFQHELRSKTIRRLMAWRRGEEWAKSGATAHEIPAGADAPAGGAASWTTSGVVPVDLGRNGTSGWTREFAYVQLYLNLKERSTAATDDEFRVTHRIPSEYIQALGRMRTDLDQFSFVEREALLYHGYTAIDAQIRRWCRGLVGYYRGVGGDPVPLTTPPLFIERPASGSTVSSMPARAGGNRGRVLNELRAASQSVFLFRTRKKYPVATLATFFLTFVLPLSLVGYWLWIRGAEWMEDAFGSALQRWWERSTAGTVNDFLVWIGGSVTFPVGPKGVLVILTFVLAAYFFLWVTFEATRKLASWLDWRRYRQLTGMKPGSPWN